MSGVAWTVSDIDLAINDTREMAHVFFVEVFLHGVPLVALIGSQR